MEYPINLISPINLIVYITSIFLFSPPIFQSHSLSLRNVSFGLCQMALLSLRDLHLLCLLLAECSLKFADHHVPLMLKILHTPLSPNVKHHYISHMTLMYHKQEMSRLVSSLTVRFLFLSSSH